TGVQTCALPICQLPGAGAALPGGLRTTGRRAAWLGVGGADASRPRTGDRLELGARGLHGPRAEAAGGEPRLLRLGRDAPSVSEGCGSATGRNRGRTARGHAGTGAAA